MHVPHLSFEGVTAICDLIQLFVLSLSSQKEHFFLLFLIFSYFKYNADILL